MTIIVQWYFTFLAEEQKFEPCIAEKDHAFG